MKMESPLLLLIVGLMVNSPQAWMRKYFFLLGSSQVLVSITSSWPNRIGFATDCTNSVVESPFSDECIWDLTRLILPKTWSIK